MADTQFLLGKLIEGDPSRDAVHIAVAPVTAGETMEPGQRAGFITSSQEIVGSRGQHIGIVDPFLTEPVIAGQRCWLYLFPNTITSLHHLWTHPAFGAVEVAAVPASEKWIREYAAEIDLTYNRLMAGADDYVASRERGQYGDYLVDGGTLEGMSTRPEFWEHYENVRGKKVAGVHKENFFSCSC